ncbi:hypothetical protein CaCOL14_005431 [Colletotrichum acutatum]|uniref:Pleckstrin homology domain-containing protein n=1 Tax=Glomerella acutata TaxID=27357 RepID=A0AAD8UQE5_GLOAC|nr:uncharacterized protein BDZ83DRAFT_748839 [Colletotrichum acutatum]KAK1728717.1 hypothetical protein BDZ83DRAFT_748839 [Colletotrichum acutatum]
MAVWETEDESKGNAAVTALPTPQDTPYRTPSRSSRKSRRSVTPPNGKKSPSPPPVPQNDKGSKRSSRNMTNDDGISVLDPRRFTPTLHANLVAEILNLRRDQEEKAKLIENLELSLHASRQEQETLQETVATTTKQSRSLQRQLALLEGGTSSALGELARERDEAVDSITETRKRLESAQKKIRSQEEDSQRVHDLWAQDKDSWEEEKRKYERRVHVAESRLKVVIDEVAAYQAAQMNGNGNDSETEDQNDAGSVRTMSLTNSVRFSMQQSPGKVFNGNSLADELNLDGDDDWQTDDGGRESAMSNYRHTRTFSRDSILSKIHRRQQSMESPQRPGSVTRGRLWMNQPVLEALEDGIQENDEDLMPPPPPPAPKVSYTDTGIQFSPPPSPKMEPAKPCTPEPPAKIEKLTEVEASPRGEWEVEANQRRKRVHVNRPLSIEPRPFNHMVSAGSQTVEEPLSPPKTPKSPYRSSTPPPPETPPTVMVSSSTQTDKPVERPQTPPVLRPVQELTIPSISIIPPTSRPTTPREHRLPQYVKDFGCQVSIISSAPTKSTAVQTEEILSDKRLATLPVHLRPSAITSRPSSPSIGIATAVTSDDPRHFTPVPGHLPPRNPRRLATKRSLSDMPSSPPVSPVFGEQTRDAYPGNNDDGPLSREGAPMRRPHRISSLFAGFQDAQSSDEVDEFDADMSDSEYRTALSAPGMRMTDSRASNRTSVSTFTSPEQTKRSAPSRNSMRLANDSYGGNLESREAPKRQSAKPTTRGYEKSTAGPSGKNVMRKAAMIQSGIASHQGRPRSPSVPESRAPDPPFPIPTRASSRRPPFSASAPSDGQRSPTKMDAPWHRRGMGRNHYRAGSIHRANSIRKVRSAAALPRNQRNRKQSRSPPPFSETTDAPESPSLPPLPYNDITSPRYDTSSNYRSHKSRLSTTTAQTATTDVNSVGGASNGASQATGVVDAIAQTMVGEWMFKYVRRRKSFGVPDNSKDDSSNDRHKRWVWLAPYERAILWSSKQPSSGSALMGKTGRKLTIQSVLDVKDDNPAPKNQGAVFNRSILILTPQRALKFTATSSERHYVWLTALSFLAHSTQAIPEIVAAPQPAKPTTVPDFEPPQPTRRPGIRDSIRLTKSKAPSVKNPGPRSIPSVPSIPSIPSSRTGDVSGYKHTEAFPPMPTNINSSSNTNNNNHQRERSGDAAEPPFIPRFTERSNQNAVHGRKRSNTGGHVPPPLSFRGFSGPGSVGQHSYTNSNAGNSVGTAGSSDIYQSQPSQGSSRQSWGMSTAGSQRTSEASSRPPGANFFDAIGTVRMEAFISPLAHSGFDRDPDEYEEYGYRARRRSKELRRRQSRSRHRDSYSSRGTRGTDGYHGSSRATVEDDYFRDDPFKGF